MSSLKGEGSGVIETEEVSMLASVSMGEEEISSGGVTDDRGRRTPWPVGLPGLSGVFMYTYIYLYILFFGVSLWWMDLFICLLWVKTQTIEIYISFVHLFKDQLPWDLFVLFILRSIADGSFCIFR